MFEPGPGQVPLDGTFNGISNQIHEIHVQIPGGPAFWTVAAPQSSVKAQLFGTSELSLTNFTVADFHDTVNGLGQGNQFPGNGTLGTLTLDIRWSPLTRVNNTTNGSRGFFVGGINATISWSVSLPDFQLASDSGGISRDVRSVLLDFDSTIPNNYVAVGRERNGAFFQ